MTWNRETQQILTLVILVLYFKQEIDNQNSHLSILTAMSNSPASVQMDEVRRRSQSLLSSSGSAQDVKAEVQTMAGISLPLSEKYRHIGVEAMLRENTACRNRQEVKFSGVFWCCSDRFLLTYHEYKYIYSSVVLKNKFEVLVMPFYTSTELQFRGKYCISTSYIYLTFLVTWQNKIRAQKTYDNVLKRLAENYFVTI